MEGSPAGQTASSATQRERLTREWIARIIERTPLDAVAKVPFARLAAVGPGLVGSVTAALELPPDQEPATFADAASVAALRTGPGAPEAIAADLASLQGVLLTELRREHRELEAFAAAAERLTALFGSIQGRIAGELVGALAAPETVDPVTKFPGPAQLAGWLGALLAEQRRYGHPFALALIDVDGLGRINAAYGRDGGDRMLVAVAAILRRQLRDVDQAFRLEEDEFAVVAPHTDATRLVAMAKRVAGVISGSQEVDGPRIAIASGIVDCPDDGLSAERLLESAAEATYAAKAAAAPVARTSRASDAILQDP